MNDQLRIAAELATASTSQALLGRLMDCATYLGASGVNNFLSRGIGEGGRPIFQARTLSDTWRQRMRDDPRMQVNADLDPVRLHTKHKSTPIFWDRSTYAAVAQNYEWEFFAEAGMYRGASVCLHLAADRHYCLGFFWEAKDVEKADERLQVATALQTFAVFAEPAAFRLANQVATPDVDEVLSTRELQSLFWASRGLSDEDTAEVLSISHRTVRKHIDSAIRKLQALNRTHAAVIATKRGLLTADLAVL